MIGDRLGRKTALVWTFILMGATSTSIGMLPTYAQVGLLAPIMLLSLRLLQGAGAGAEFGIASVYAVEHAQSGKKGLIGALPAIGVLLGQILSVLVSAHRLGHFWRRVRNLGVAGSFPDQCLAGCGRSVDSRINGRNARI
jgi:MFS family permease